LKLKSLESELDCEVEGEKKRGIMVVTLRGRCKVVFMKMDKSKGWVRGKDVHWAIQVGVFNFLSIRLTPIWPLVKEWLLGIIWYTLERIDLVVQGQLISLIEKIVGEMLCLSNAIITIPPNYKQDEVTDMCIRLALKDIVV
jgi:hypothetical protein